MSQQHEHDHSSTSRSLGATLFINIYYYFLEQFVGLWIKCVAILSGAIHDLGNYPLRGTSWRLVNGSSRRSHQRFSYGYRRFSLIRTLISTVFSICGSVLIMSEAIPQLLNPKSTNAASLALFVLVSIVVNGAAILHLHQDQTPNGQVETWYLWNDVVGWLAVLIVGVTLLFRDILILDPSLSILLSSYLLYNVVRNLRGPLSLFLQTVPKENECGMRLANITFKPAGVR